MNKDFLQHSGVKGMKWRRGKPNQLHQNRLNQLQARRNAQALQISNAQRVRNDVVSSYLKKIRAKKRIQTSSNKVKTVSSVGGGNGSRSLRYSDVDFNTLQHWGVLGMHWGVRRGSSRFPGTSSSADAKRVKSLRNKRLDEMSNEELKALTTRMQLERQYKDLSRQDHSAGQKWVSGILTNVATTLVTQAISSGAKATASYLVKNAVRSGG